jgi:transitional endoplasmic reticulum ATPase
MMNSLQQGIIMSARRVRYSTKSPDIAPLVRLWLLRILMVLGGHREFVTEHGFTGDTLAEVLGLANMVDPFSNDVEVKTARKVLRTLHQKAEIELRGAKSPDLLCLNVERLSELVGLSEIDCRILEFSVLIQTERLLDDAADWLGRLSSVKVFHALSVILDLPEDTIRAALSAHGLLACSGLVSVDRGGLSSLRGKLNLLSDGFADAMLSSEANPINLLRGTVSAVAPGHLGLEDYGHIQESLKLLEPYLLQALGKGRTGVNVFLHGAPGTGKSQLARALAAKLESQLFEVSSEDSDGDPVNGERRLRAFRAAQSFFAKSRALIVFDEAEDVFNDGDFFGHRKSTAQSRKAWINRALEENPVPTLWLSNSIHGVDPAFVRRFDMVFELPMPPKSQRQRIVQAVCEDLIDADAAARIAEVESLAPAVVAKAASVVRALGEQLDAHAKVKALEHLIDNTLQAQGHDGLKQGDPNRLPELYDPAFVHADIDLAQLAEGLKASRSGRLCLYGPPGTGKTAFGRWLAERLEIPLLVKRASDLLSPYIGQCEINMARAFREAAREGALLLIDEVDSFLQDRRRAERSWEVSQVNEMLVQMESFAGIFIASTNLMDGLDQAALRRFDLKVKFDFLQPRQAAALLRRHCETLGLAMPDSSEVLALQRLHNLTPCDFAAVVRQNRFHPIKAAPQMVEMLQAECALKGVSTSPMGFLH